LEGYGDLVNEGAYPIFINMGPRANPIIRVLNVETPVFDFEK